MIAVDLAESPMKTVAQLVGLIVSLRTTLASDHDAGRGDAGQPGEPDEFPAHAHQLHRVLA
jgi:hypothetical protein